MNFVRIIFILILLAILSELLVEGKKSVKKEKGSTSAKTGGHTTSKSSSSKTKEEIKAEKKAEKIKAEKEAEKKAHANQKKKDGGCFSCLRAEDGTTEKIAPPKKPSSKPKEALMSHPHQLAAPRSSLPASIKRQPSGSKQPSRSKQPDASPKPIFKQSEYPTKSLTETDSPIEMKIWMACAEECYEIIKKFKKYKNIAAGDKNLSEEKLKSEFVARGYLKEKDFKKVTLSIPYNSRLVKVQKAYKSLSDFGETDRDRKDIIYLGFLAKWVLINNPAEGDFEAEYEFSYHEDLMDATNFDYLSRTFLTRYLVNKTVHFRPEARKLDRGA